MPPETDRELLTAALKHLRELRAKGSSSVELLALVGRLEVRLDVPKEKRVRRSRAFNIIYAPGTGPE